PNPEEPLTLKVKQTTPFQKIYGAVAEHRGVALTSFRLQYEGQRILPNESTPADLNFDNEESID
ncbi:hypothetical protein PPACK8108_LOCUS24982, partial [Phakopsora pachyrhizi]